MLRYQLEITAGISGSIVMIFELLGSRILAPYIGTSIFVWTSIIGIILGSLSIGYFIGGVKADKNATRNDLVTILLYATLFMILTIIFKNIILIILVEYIRSIKINAIISSILLFTPVSITLGMISPYTAKLKIMNLEKSGTTIGTLYAISTMGSIIGTFLAGFVLIPTLGTTNLLIILATILLAMTFYINPKNKLLIKIILAVIILIILFSNNLYHQYSRKNNFFDYDTSYNRVWIFDGMHNNEPTRFMQINKESNSAMYINKPDLAYDYAKFYNLAIALTPDIKSTLMLGGAGYSYPKEFLQRFPNSTIDVIEIDPQLTEIAKKHFALQDSPRLNSIHEDARTYINTTTKKYDVIFGDAFSSFYSLPYQLTTQEAIRKHYDILNENGAVITNIISSIEGEKGKFLRAEYATYKSIFPQVFIFTVNTDDPKAVQNIMLVGVKSSNEISQKNNTDEIQQLLNTQYKKNIPLDMPVITDEYAPIDQYIQHLL